MKKICSSLKTDGFGAQYWANMTCIAHCRNNNFIYRHSPYIRTAHFKIERQLNPKELCNFTGLKSDDDDDLSREIDDKRAWIFPWSRDNDKWFTPEICKEIRDMYYSVPKSNDIVKCDVAIHIRRGDIKEGNNRHLPLTYYQQIISKFKQTNPDFKIAIFSEGELDDFQELVQENVEFHLNEELMMTFHSMVMAPHFVMGYSCFSMCASILNTNQVYCEKLCGFNKLNSWIDTRTWIAT